MEQIKQRIKSFIAELDSVLAKLDIHKQEQELGELRQQMAVADFWKNNLKAQATAKQEADITRRIEPWVKLKKLSDELKELAALGDESITLEIGSQLDEAEKTFQDLKKDLRFRGPFDDHDVILNIYAGAGGTDAQDWAQMLERMYLRWAETQDFKSKVVDESPGEEAGVKSATIEISGGSYLYGKLAGEHGVHRLVRLSPFNADNLRQTSFAKVDVLPVIEKPGEVEIDESDLRIDVFRAGGRGGQSVNTTDSAVRVTHLPTGVTVTIQNERSQLQNKEMAMIILRSRLATMQLEQHAKNIAELKGPSEQAAWGNQIRNYVLHPYKQVKDLRSGYESSDVEKVLDGNLNPLIDAWLEAHNR